MTNRRLTTEELALANELLAHIRQRLIALSSDDKNLLFAYRRKIHKELMHDERGKPGLRRKLKEQKWKEQGGLCALCSQELPEKEVELDRFQAVEGYTAKNTRLVHHECHRKQQAERGYS